MPEALEKPADKSVDWDAAAAYMNGRGDPDGEEAGEESDAAPTEREFSYRGKKVRVDAETFALLESLRNEARGTNGRIGAELARTKERLARLEGAASARPSGERSDEPELRPPDPKLAIQDFAEYQRQDLAYHRAEMDRLKRDLEARYAGDQEQLRRAADAERKNTEWADRFYSAHDHLDLPIVKPIVSQVYIENKAEIDDIEQSDGTDAAQARLAELADQRLVEVRKLGKSGTQSRRPPRVESSGGAPRTVERPAADESSYSGGQGWLAKERARMRGEGASK